ncbi:MAG: thiamine phosphate synthase [Spirochaetales bacterium]|nr:thiamine phosphate synthase [Spirochaetales bacterium]
MGLYLVTDEILCRGRPVEEVVSAAVRGGVSMVQLREKELSTRPFIERAVLLKDLLAPHGIPLIINDRVDVALAAGADGVHLGQHDMPYEKARRLLGPTAVVGLSVETLAQVEEADGVYLDYLAVSPVFPTASKTDTGEGWGLEGLSAVRRATSLPLVAIGGINAANAASVVRAGADTLAVVSAICSADEPERVARELTHIVERETTARIGGET